MMKIFKEIINKLRKKKSNDDKVSYITLKLYEKVNTINYSKVCNCDVGAILHIISNDKIFYSFEHLRLNADNGNELIIQYIKLNLFDNINQYYILFYEDDYFMVTSMEVGKVNEIYKCDGEDGLKQFLNNFIFINYENIYKNYK